MARPSDCSGFVSDVLDVLFPEHFNCRCVLLPYERSVMKLSEAVADFQRNVEAWERSDTGETGSYHPGFGSLAGDPPEGDMHERHHRFSRLSEAARERWGEAMNSDEGYDDPNKCDPATEGVRVPPIAIEFDSQQSLIKQLHEVVGIVTDRFGPVLAPDDSPDGETPGPDLSASETTHRLMAHNRELARAITRLMLLYGRSEV